MNVIMSFTLRNLRLYFRNKAAVFFSLLSVLIIIALYALFLGELQVNAIKSAMTDKNGVLFANIKDISWMVNAWIMAGLIAVNAVNITLTSLGQIVDDIDKKISKDFLSSPIKRSQVVFGYIVSSWILGILMSLVTFFLVEAYIILKGGQLLSLAAIVEALLIIVISVISFSSVLFFVITYIKSNSAFSTLSIILGTLIGFLAGIYVPVGELPKTMQTVISCFPVSYSASLLREIFISEPTSRVYGGAVNKSQLINQYYQEFGVHLYINGHQLSWVLMIAILLIVAVVFYALSIIRVVRNKLS